MISIHEKLLEKRIKDAVGEYAELTGAFVDTIKVRYTSACPDNMTCFSTIKTWIDDIIITASIQNKIFAGDFETAKKKYEQGQENEQEQNNEV